MAKDPAAAPDDLDAVSKRLWRLTKRQLAAQGTWEDSDADERYIRAVERGRVARAGVGDGTALGASGQVVQHPSLKTAREADRDAHLYAGDLLLTPSARRRYEIEAHHEEGKFSGKL